MIKKLALDAHNIFFYRLSIIIIHLSCFFSCLSPTIGSRMGRKKRDQEGKKRRESDGGDHAEERTLWGRYEDEARTQR